MDAPEFHLDSERAFTSLAKITMLSQKPRHQNIFLLGYRLYLPEGINLVNLWIKEYKGAKMKERDQLIMTMSHSNRIENFLNIWTKNYPSDWNTKSLASVMKILSQHNSKNMIQKITHNFLRVTDFEAHPGISITPRTIIKATRNNSRIIKFNGENLVKVPDGFDFLNSDPDSIAREFTRIEWNIFINIKPLELIYMVWNKEKRDRKASNIMALINRFNQVCNWIGTEITSTKKSKEQSIVLQRFIRIAWICLKSYKNFNTLMSIMAGLHMSSIQRLKRAWRKISSKSMARFREMETLMSGMHNFRDYQAKLDDSSYPKFPYLGKFIRDISVIYDGNSKYNPNGSINFERLELILTQWETLHKFQRNGYRKSKLLKQSDQVIYSFLNNLLFMSEDDLYEFSLKYQPLQNGLNTLKLSSRSSSSNQNSSSTQSTTSD